MPKILEPGQANEKQINIRFNTAIFKTIKVEARKKHQTEATYLRNIIVKFMEENRMIEEKNEPENCDDN